MSRWMVATSWKHFAEVFRAEERKRKRKCFYGTGMCSANTARFRILEFTLDIFFNIARISSLNI